MSDYIYWIVYLIIMNFTATTVTILDKRRAKRHLWRISEKKLLLLAALGGCPAMFVTMLLIHHKTRHKKFMVGLPAIFFLQMFALYKFIMWDPFV